MTPGTELIRATYNRSGITRLQIVTVKKVYKNGNIVLDEKLYGAPQQWTKEETWSEGGKTVSWKKTGENIWSTIYDRLYDMSKYDGFREQIEARNNLVRQTKVQKYLAGQLSRPNLLSPDKLARINAILNED